MGDKYFRSSISLMIEEVAMTTELYERIIQIQGLKSNLPLNELRIYIDLKVLRIEINIFCPYFII